NSNGTKEPVNDENRTSEKDPFGWTFVCVFGCFHITLLANTRLLFIGLYGENGLLPIASKLNCGNLLLSLSLPLYYYYCYNKKFEVGDTFLWFQWDTLLLEAGALCCLLARMPLIGSSSSTDNISIFLIRWLVFRLMYASGVVKLTSQCPAWWSLTALNIHFESQCLPTWIAYYAHHSPEWLRRLSVAATFYIEMILPPLFLVPFKALRTFAFYPQVIVKKKQFCCLDMSKIFPCRVEHIGSYYKVSSLLILAFSRRGFASFVDWSVLYLLYIGIVAYILEVITAIIRLSPFASLSESAKSVVPSQAKSLYEWSNNYQLTHAYGLFRRMTGLYGRPEVIVEGAYEPNGPWVPFNFYAKPLKLDAKPRFILPHQPRLDWQMWFAALGAYQHNPFFISLVHHLLRNNTEVTYLMDRYPFEHKLPKFIRAQLYLYHYTAPNKQGEWPVNYWRRDLQEEYMPPITKDDPNVRYYLQENGFLLKEKFRFNNENKRLEGLLKSVHLYVREYDPAWLIYSLLIAHLMAMITMKLFN
ncbi:unnamed protein product, partial [Anisakis simplex]|uniref:Lipase maturation factor n=1 Tax=Anisakis simplex TaxID=6269 RepID=A0A0M3JVW4_ANISI